METLDTLPGEGKRCTKVLKRRRCEVCGEPAHYRHAFLYEHYRTNPASSAYGKDNCSWCCDEEVFVCRTCKPPVPRGCSADDSRFPATLRYQHMFLRWHEDKEAPDDLQR